MAFEFLPQAIPDVVLVRPRVMGDARGFFMETWRRDEFAAGGIAADFIQDNHARSSRRGVLRGLHFQRAPHAQAKLVRCVRGRVLDVTVDIRRGSPTHGKHVAVELSDDNRAILFVPRGLAHGYLTLTDETDVLYKVDAPYAPQSEGGLAWNDPDVAIAWPVAEPVLSDRDRAWPRLKDVETGEHFLVKYARERGPIAPGTFRVVVLEHDDRTTIHDCTSFDEARRYAYDSASEMEHDNTPIAIVVDSTFAMVEKGGHYGGL